MRLCVKCMNVIVLALHVAEMLRVINQVNAPFACNYIYTSQSYTMPTTDSGGRSLICHHTFHETMPNETEVWMCFNHWCVPECVVGFCWPIWFVPHRELQIKHTQHFNCIIYTIICCILWINNFGSTLNMIHKRKKVKSKRIKRLSHYFIYIQILVDVRSLCWTTPTIHLFYPCQKIENVTKCLIEQLYFNTNEYIH